MRRHRLVVAVTSGSLGESFAPRAARATEFKGMPVVGSDKASGESLSEAQARWEGAAMMIYEKD